MYRTTKARVICRVLDIRLVLREATMRVQVQSDEYAVETYNPSLRAKWDKQSSWGRNTAREDIASLLFCL